MNWNYNLKNIGIGGALRHVSPHTGKILNIQFTLSHIHVNLLENHYKIVHEFYLLEQNHYL